MKGIKGISNSTIILIIIVVALGFLGGVVGELWVNSFLLPSPYLNFKSYSDLAKRLDELVQGQPAKRNLNERDIAINETIGKARPAVVKLYRYKNLSASQQSGLFSGDLIGQAAIITNDGWLLTGSEMFKNEKNNFWAVTAEHKIYKAVKKSADEKSGAAFLKIETNNLPVINFSLKNDLVDGETVFLFGSPGSVISSNIENLNYSELSTSADYIHNSEDFYKNILLKDNFSAEYFGGPVITLEGKMAGLLADNAGTVIPVDRFLAVMKTAVKAESSVRPRLGIKFYDLSELLKPGVEQGRGAMIIPGGVSADSPAKGLLLPGDIILKVENEELNGGKNLPDILAMYHPGDNIKFLVKRGSAEIEISVKLGKVSS